MSSLSLVFCLHLLFLLCLFSLFFVLRLFGFIFLPLPTPIPTTPLSLPRAVRPGALSYLSCLFLLSCFFVNRAAAVLSCRSLSLCARSMSYSNSFLFSGHVVFSSLYHQSNDPVPFLPGFTFGLASCLAGS